MDLRRAAEAVVADHERFGLTVHPTQCSHTAAIDKLQEALQQPDMLSEAVELLRELRGQWGLTPVVTRFEEQRLRSKIRHFLSRYDEQKQAKPSLPELRVLGWHQIDGRGLVALVAPKDALRIPCNVILDGKEYRVNAIERSTTTGLIGLVVSEVKQERTNESV